MPEHDPTRTDRLALYMRARAAEKAAHDDAVRVVERWNAALAGGRGALWSPTIRCAVLAGMPWLDVYCQRSRYPHPRPSPARVGRQPRARAAVFVVPGFSAYAQIVGLHALPPAANVRASAY
jgi:hypothetical protein